MPKYTATLKETVFYTVEVEADDEEAAGEIAAEEWAQSDDPNNDYCGDGRGVEVDNCDQMESEIDA